ncbi:molybdate ABC transporter substrate-binding protein [Spartinivicinus poritis]|uniref:Molybdate ABC transporter substrate-binding protein n=1 Tax=Spartinivicinus poritis TaxID=2994640 RepID=A0ABT5UA01_9GAMM|nr:molybdate ABC transporter substrate-binding protein [Spartinivicinus sp. A2-2]MDE1463127.1 molybdate ABC transporter substrate-binding protein [Spartinivicinus sp. A2-2]
MTKIKGLFTLILTLFCQQAFADKNNITVAVSSNFKNTLHQLIRHYKQNNPKTYFKVSSGATGLLYTQIKNGAPYDVFLAADQRRPVLLDKENLIIPNSRFTYAYGKLVFWHPKDNFHLTQGSLGQAITNSRFISIANPDLAPYGMAAEQSLKKLKLWEAAKYKVVMGNNIAQAYQFTASGNADLGLVALSQVITLKNNTYWVVPQKHYQPIVQQAVLLKNAITNDAAVDFIAFLKSSDSHNIIQRNGYGTSSDDD